RYQDYRIFDGKKALPGLPATYANEAQAETLELILVDEVAKLRLVLSYTIFKELAVLTRSARLENQGTQTVAIQRLASSNLDFYARELEVIDLHGAWGHERSEEHTSELQSRFDLVCRLLLEKKKER